MPFRPVLLLLVTTGRRLALRQLPSLAGRYRAGRSELVLARDATARWEGHAGPLTVRLRRAQLDCGRRRTLAIGLHDAGGTKVLELALRPDGALAEAGPPEATCATASVEQKKAGRVFFRVQ